MFQTPLVLIAIVFILVKFLENITLITGNISVDPMKALAYAPATIVSELAYGPTRGVVRGLLQTPRAGLSVSRPTTSGLLAENINQGILGRGQ